MSLRIPLPAILSVTTILIFTIDIALAFPQNAKSSDENYTVCRTPQCQTFADDLLKSINPSADPCDDFYHFACGNWVKNNPTPKHLPTISLFATIANETSRRIRTILEEDDKPSETNSLKMARRIYRMCMDDGTLENEGIRHLLANVNELGGWPITLPSSEWRNDVTWQQIYNRISQKALPTTSLFDVQVTIDVMNVQTSKLALSPPEFFLERDFLVNEENAEKINTYRTFIERVAQAFAKVSNVKVPGDAIKRDASAIVDLEIEIAKITPTRSEMMDMEKLYNLLTIAKFQEKYDAEDPHNDVTEVDWLNTVRNVVSPSGIEIDESEKLMVLGMQFFNKLKRLLAQTPVRTIVNYLQWHYVRQMLKYTDSQMRQLVFQTEKILYNIQEPKQRWLQCVESTNLDNAVSYEYVKRYFPQSAKETSLRLLDGIFDAVEYRIRQSSWMDEETKTKSVEKLRSILPNIGYPDWYNETSIDIYYKNFKRASNYFENVQNLFVFNKIKDISVLRKPVDKSLWLMQPTVVNAYYYPVHNSIVFTAAVLSDVFFDPDRPQHINYGTFGTVVGHEISHGFDNMGRKYDKTGNLVQWWSNETINAYNKQVECLVEQYNKYTFAELEELNKTVHVDGKRTLGENIGDSAGLTVAFEAYSKHMRENGAQDIRLPGLEEYSSDQLFFMSFGRMFCEHNNPNYVDLMLQFDEHASGHTRVRGAPANLDAFGKAFKCPLGSPMNPVKKCKLW